MTEEQIAEALLTDVPAYKESLVAMIIRGLNDSPGAYTYWRAWFAGAEGSALEEAERGGTVQKPKTLYYTVAKETQMVGDVEECTGWKDLTLYEIRDNQPKLLAEIAVDDGSPFSSEEEIQTWLDENGYEDEDFKFTQL